MITAKVLFGVVVVDAVGAVVAASGGIDGGTYLGIAALIFGGGAAAAYISGRARMKSGESGGTAVHSASETVSEMAGAVKDVVAPLREEIARLHGVIAEKQTRLLAKTEASADLAVQLAEVRAAFEKRRHKDAQELAVLAAEITTLRLVLAEREQEIESLNVRYGQAPDRREGDRRDDG